MLTSLNFFQLCYTDILFTEQEVSVSWEIRFCTHRPTSHSFVANGSGGGGFAVAFLFSLALHFCCPQSFHSEKWEGKLEQEPSSP